MNPCVYVFDPKEKASDVNIAVHMVNDGWQNQYDVAVLISNDSDLLQAIKIVKTACGKRVHIISPNAEANIELNKAANYKGQISAKHLSSSQLPDLIPFTTIRRPDAWSKSCRPRKGRPI